jgi:CheY-like chemotaxis protein
MSASVLDIEMRSCGGIATAAFMRGYGRYANTPIIAYTSLDESEVITRGKEVQIDASWRKGQPPPVHF